MNGKMAAPAWPRPEIHPTQPVKSHLGRMPFAWLTRMGYIGPRRSPMTDTATAFSTSEGTTQTVTSSLERGLLQHRCRACGMARMGAHWMAKKA